MINSATSTLDDGWYAVNSDITISGRITCSGGVNLILCDNAELTVPNGISVNESDAGLTIYSQSKGENKGKLTINSAENSDDAAIGGVSARDSGRITINGGDISVTTVSADSAAIGGGKNGKGLVTINDGTVTVNKNCNGDSNGAGIGGGSGGSGTVTINGGNVNVSKSDTCTVVGAGIGGGKDSDPSQTTVALSWTNVTDSIISYSYSGTVTLKKTFLVGGNGKTPGDVSYNSDLAGRSITPACLASWYNYDGTHFSSQVFEPGRTPYFGSPDPTKPSDGVNEYEFIGWDPEIKPITEDTNYTAVFGFVKTPYVDENGAQKEESAEKMTTATTNLSNGWYAVKSDLDISERITCSGGVNLILCDNATLTVPKGITVNDNEATLTIYCQSSGSGSLIIPYETTDNNIAAIGGEDHKSSGPITINGGKITVTGKTVSAALIGGGRYGKGFVTINNGTVSTEVYSKYDRSYYLASFGAVIGGGYSGDAYVTINGGKVTVNRRYADVSYGAGIGSGYKGIAEVFINKGVVTVNDIGNGTVNGAAIGAASNSNLSNRVVINDGNITVDQSGSGIYNAAGIGGGEGSIAGDEITIKGTDTVVIAEGKGLAAGIGGGAQGSIGNINILAGQISAHSQNGFGIGAGKISENESGQTGNIVLGYSNQSNFIEADSFGTDASKIRFYSEKEFIIDGTNTLATAENILSGCKLIPIIGCKTLFPCQISYRQCKERMERYRRIYADLHIHRYRRYYRN